MKSLLLTLVLALSLSAIGCTTMENAAKATFDIAWDAAEKTIAAKIPLLEGKALEAAKVAADKALQAACDYTREKTAAVSEYTIAKINEKTGVNVKDYDADKNGVLALNEINAYLKGLKEEQDRRKESGEEPIPWYYYLAGMVLGPPAYSLLQSSLKRGQYFRIEEKVKEMTTPKTTP